MIDRQACGVFLNEHKSRTADKAGVGNAQTFGDGPHQLRLAGAEGTGQMSARRIHDRFRRMPGLVVLRDLALPRYRVTLLRRTEAGGA